jgi:hypothetical protein
VPKNNENTDGCFANDKNKAQWEKLRELLNGLPKSLLEKTYAHGLLSLKNTIFLTVIYFVFTVQLKTQSIHDGKVNVSLPAMYIFSQPILSISLPLKQKE